MKDPRTVPFQGERGAYSEQAVMQYFHGKVDLLPLKTMGEVFQAVEKDRSKYGVVPIENSVEGSVNETYDLLLGSSLKVVSEINLRIVHCLVGHEGSSISSVKEVYSHPQALGQCRKFITSHGFTPIPVYDTAGAVKMIKERGIMEGAAIASERAARIYSMKVLEKGIEDSRNNYTRFLVLSKGEAERTGRDKTSIIFSTKHLPGALYRAVGVFARRRLNLTMIVSRPTKTKAWEYNFYVDFEGHVNDELVKDALDALEGKTRFIKVLGSYPRAP